MSDHPYNPQILIIFGNNVNDFISETIFSIFKDLPSLKIAVWVITHMFLGEKVKKWLAESCTFSYHNRTSSRSFTVYLLLICEIAKREDLCLWQLLLGLPIQACSRPTFAQRKLFSDCFTSVCARPFPFLNSHPKYKLDIARKALDVQLYMVCFVWIKCIGE